MVTYTKNSFSDTSLFPASRPDFGDYSDAYYSVQTTEGEQIAQLIAGYIDIILKKQRAKDHIGIEGDDGSAMVEDTVSPIK